MTVVAAAIRYRGVVYALPALCRHHDVIRHICERLGADGVGENEQGFLDDAGNFLTREQALVVAEAAGQLRAGVPLWGRRLYSENVW